PRHSRVRNCYRESNSTCRIHSGSSASFARTCFRFLQPISREGSSSCQPAASLHSERAAERPRGIVGLSAVVIDKYGVVAAVAEQGTAEFSDLGRGFHPTRGFRVEFPKLLQ